jgi:hypothetical protein
MTPTTAPESVLTDHKSRIEALAAGAKPPAPSSPTASAASSPSPKEDAFTLLEKMMDLATAITNGVQETNRALTENKAVVAAMQATLPAACVEAVKRDWILRAGIAEQRDPLVAVKQDLQRLLPIVNDLVGSTKALFWIGIGIVAAVVVVIARSLW